MVAVACESTPTVIWLSPSRSSRGHLEREWREAALVTPDRLAVDIDDRGIVRRAEAEEIASGARRGHREVPLVPHEALVIAQLGRLGQPGGRQGRDRRVGHVELVERAIVRRHFAADVGFAIALLAAIGGLAVEAGEAERNGSIE